MSNEIKNRQHAIGTFVAAETVALPFTQRIVNGVGVDSFVRNSVGNYTAKLHEPIGFGGATIRAGLPANFAGNCGAQLSQDGTNVLLTVFDILGLPADAPLVTLEVVSVIEGEGSGPSPALPNPPTPVVVPQLTLLGWLTATGGGSIVAQRGGVTAIAVNGAGDYTVTHAAGTVLSLSATVDSISTLGFACATILSATTIGVKVNNGSNVPTNLNYFVQFYGNQ